jgi:hypothetical protein
VTAQAALDSISRIDDLVSDLRQELPAFGALEGHLFFIILGSYFYLFSGPE